MHKQDMIKAVAGNTGITQADVRRVLDEVGEQIAHALAGYEEVKIGFAHFKVVKRAARLARNPRTGEKVQVPECYVVKVKAGKELDDAVKNGDAPEAN